jgi:hypothetical protein
MSNAPDKNVVSSYDNNTRDKETVLPNRYTELNSDGHVRHQI